MAEVFDSTKRMITVNGVDLQEWRVERLADATFEWHSYVGHNYSKTNKTRLSAGAIWMILKLENPGGINEITTYRMGRTGIPGSGEDTLQDEWDSRAVSTYYRYDEMLKQFFG